MLRTHVTGRQCVDNNACQSRSLNGNNVILANTTILKKSSVQLNSSFFKNIFIQIHCYLLTLLVIHSDPVRCPKRCVYALFMTILLGTYKNKKQILILNFR